MNERIKRAIAVEIDELEELLHNPLRTDSLQFRLNGLVDQAYEDGADDMLKELMPYIKSLISNLPNPNEK